MLTVLALLATLLAADPADDVVARALEASPSLRAADAATEAVRARAATAGAWPDPVIAVAYSNSPVDSFGLTTHPMSGVQLDLRQAFKPVGWSRARRAVLEAEAEGSEADRDEAALGLALMVRRTWHTLARARALHALTLAHRDQVVGLEEAVRTRYEVGSAGQGALLRITLLRDRLTDDLAELERDATTLGAALDRAVSTETPGSWPTPTTLEPAPVPDMVDWVSLARAQRPAYAALQAAAGAADARVQLARTDRAPDVSVSLGYRIRLIQSPSDPGTNFITAGLAVPIPAGSLRTARGQQQAAEAQGQSVAARRDALDDEIRTGMEAVLARWRRAVERATTYRDVMLPLAERTLVTTRTDFSVGRATFAALLEAEIALLELERAVVGATTESWLAHAEAQALVGGLP